MTTTKFLLLLLIFISGAFATSVPAGSGGKSGSQLVGQAFTQELCIKNDGNTTGYQPQFEVVTPPGITINSADFEGVAAVKYTESCSVAECNVTNPYTNVVTKIDENQTFYVLAYPIGSFATTLPKQCLDVKFDLGSVSSGVQLGVPLDIKATPLFSLGETPVDDGNHTYGTPNSIQVIPNIFTLAKSNDATESERATGPSYPIKATLKLDVATGETINPVVMTDSLDAAMHFVSVDQDAGCTISPHVSNPGGDLLIECGSVTGVQGVDKTIIYTYYIDENRSDGSAVLPPDGAHKKLTNNAEATAEYGGTTLPPAEANATVWAKSITMHKTSTFINVTPPDGLTPGDTIVYSLKMQTSDYFLHENIIVTDILGDGQTMVTAINPPPTSYSLSSGPSGIFDANNTTHCGSKDPTTGECVVTFRLSDQLIADGHSGTIPSGTTIEIKFETVVDRNYTVINNQDPLAMGDKIKNDVTVQPDILGIGTGTPDGSSEINEIVNATFTKSIYAVNSDLNLSSPYKIKAGDEVTYRLHVTLPVKSFYDSNLTDFLPSPFFDATEVDPNNPTTSGGTPPAGHWGTGPDNSYSTLPTFSNNASENKLVWNYGDITNSEQNSTIDILFTVTAKHEPMADNLHLTNIGVTSYKSASGDTHGGSGFQEIITQTPQLKIDKNIVATSNNQGQTLPSKTLDKVDANDTITYSIHLENIGHAIAYNVNITDRFIQGGLAGARLNSCTISNTDTNSSTTTASGDLFAGTYNLDQLDARSYYDINYTCVVDQNASPGADIDNNVTLLSYYSTSNTANQTQENNFVQKDIFSEAKLIMASKMEIVKNIIGSSIPDTNPNDNLNQGEIVNFEINVTLGEGTYTNYALIDNTCTNLQLVSTSVNVTASGTSGTVVVAGTGGSVDGNLSYTCEKQAIASGTNTATVTDGNTTKTAQTHWTVTNPNVITSKKMNPPQADAGDTVTVTMEWTNDTSHPAYKCSIVDPLDTSIFDINTVSVTTTPAGYTCSVVGNEVQCNYTGDLTLPCPNGPAEFTVNVRNDVKTSSNLVNELTFTGVTLPDGHVGENNTTINGSMESNATATLNLSSPPRPIKRLLSTSENFTDPGDTNVNNTPEVAIGEVIEVELKFGFYEGTTIDVILEERFLNSGRLVYVPGTMQISRDDANLSVADSDINNALATTALNSFTSVDDAKLNITSTQISLPLGDVLNNNATNGVHLSHLLLKFKVKVQNKSSVQAGELIRDRGYVHFKDGASGVLRNAYSVIKSARAFEPLPTIVKSVSQGTVEVGTALTYTIKVCNDENNDSNNPHRATSGFEWTISDKLPDEIVPTGNYVIDAGTTGAVVDINISGQDITGTIDRLDRGECIFIDYDAIVQPTAHFSQILTNTAKFQTTSLPGTHGTAGDLTGLANQAPGELNGERIGDGSAGGINDLHGENAASVVVNEGILTKEVIGHKPFYAIGEKVHYRIERGLSKGLANNVQMHDTLPVGLDVNISDIQVLIGANIVATNNPPIITKNGQVLTLDFGDLNVTALSGIRIDYNATVENSISNQDGTNLDNDANTTHVNPNNPGQLITLKPIKPAQTVVVGEPNLFMQKRHTSTATQIQAGDTITWEVTITNNGHTTAFDVDWNDTLPTHLAEIHNSSLVLHGTPAVLTGTTTALNSSHIVENNTTMFIPSFDLPVGSSVVVTFDSIAQNSVVAGETLINNTDATYQSLLNGGRGHTDCGDDDNDGTLNNYCESASANIDVNASLAIDKHLQGNNDKFTIGDEVTYEIRLSFIEGNIANVVLHDELPAGLSYVSHTYHNGAPRMIFDHAKASVNSGTPTDIVIEFGDINNSADGNRSNDYIDVELTVRVDNVLGNQDGYKPENGDTAGTKVRVTTDSNASAVTVPVPIMVVEPDLNVSKTVTPTISGTPSQALGDIVTYHIHLSHSSTSHHDAYDINFTDTLDTGLIYVPNSATGATVTQNGQVLTFSFAHLAQGDTRDISYKAQIDPNAVAGTALNNKLETLFSGNTDANGSVDGYRNGMDGVGPDATTLNNYALQTVVPVIPNEEKLTPVKEQDFKVDTNNDGYINAGDILEYNLSTTNNLGYSVSEVNVTDTLDPNVTLMLNSIVINGTAYGANSATDWTSSGYWYNYTSTDVDISYNSDTNYFEVYWQNILNDGDILNIIYDVKINDGNVTTILFADNTDINLTAGNEVTAGTVISNVFIVDSNRTVPATSNEVNETTQIADFNITKKVNPLATDTLGKTLTYTVVVENNGTVALTDINISDVLSNGTILNVGSPAESNSSGISGTLDVGEKWTYTFDYNITQADLDAGGVLQNIVTLDTNQTHVKGKKDANASTQIIQHPDLNITKVLDGNYTDNDNNGELSLGDTLHYRITMENNGTITLQNVEVKDSKITPSIQLCQTVNVGGTCVLQGYYVVTQADVDAGEVINTATANSNATPLSSTNHTEPVPQHPSFTVSKTQTGGANPVTAAGEKIIYTIVVTNTGNMSLTGVKATENYPGFGVGTLSASVESLSSNSILDVGEKWTYTATYTVTQADINALQDLTNTISIKPNEANSQTANATTSVQGTFDLDLLKRVNTSLSPGPYVPGHSVVYTLTVVNKGTLDATNVQISDYIPAGLTLADVNWRSSGGIATLKTPIARVVAGTSVSVNIIFKINDNLHSTNLVNNAKIKSANHIDPTPGSSSASINITCPCNICIPCECMPTLTLTVSDITDKSAQLKWNYSGNCDGFEIYNNGQFVTYVNANTNSYKITNLKGKTEYTVKVLTVLGDGGNLSKTVVFKTGDDYGWLPAIYHMLSD